MKDKIFLSFLSPYYLNLQNNEFTELLFKKNKSKVEIDKAISAQILTYNNYRDKWGSEGTIVVINPTPFNGTFVSFFGTIKVKEFTSFGSLIDKIDKWEMEEAKITSIGNIGSYTALIRCDDFTCEVYYAEVLGGYFMLAIYGK